MQCIHIGTFRRTGWCREKREFFMWERSTNAWSSDLGCMIDHLRDYGFVLVDRQIWACCGCLQQTVWSGIRNSWSFFQKTKSLTFMIHEIFKSPWYVLDEKHSREQSKRFLEWTDDVFYDTCDQRTDKGRLSLDVMLAGKVKQIMDVEEANLWPCSSDHETVEISNNEDCTVVLDKENETHLIKMLSNGPNLTEDFEIYSYIKILIIVKQLRNVFKLKEKLK